MGFVIAGRINSELCVLNSSFLSVGDEFGALHALGKHLSLAAFQPHLIGLYYSYREETIK